MNFVRSSGILVATLLPFWQVSAAGFQYQSFLSVAGAPTYYDVFPAAINNHAEVVGSFTDRSSSASVRNGSFVFKNGKLVVVAVPGASFTSLTGVNNAGLAVGTAASNFAGSSVAYGKVSLRPVVLRSGDLFIIAGINDESQVIGLTPKRSSEPAGIYKYNGLELAILQQQLAVPGASFTSLTGINNAGQVVGTYTDGAGTHAFLYADGLYATFEVPGATQGSTTPAAINNKGEIVGSYTNPEDPGLPHGFVEKDGAYTTLDYPGTPGGTRVAGVNDKGVVVGSYFPPGDRLHYVAGFIATPRP